MMSDRSRASLQRGDLIWFRQTCRGGYGFQRDVPAVFIQETLRRCSIDVPLHTGGWKRISVKPDNIRARLSHGE